MSDHAAAATRSSTCSGAFPWSEQPGPPHYDLSPSHVAAAAFDLESPAFERILGRLADIEPVIVLGLIENSAAKLYNTAVVIARGRLITRYRKTHLLQGEQGVFERGGDHPVFDVDGIKVGINICYDLQFAESVEAAVGAGAELLACPCNNMLRPSTAEDWKLRHNEIRCRRAREARVWILSSDVTGEHDGRVSYGPTAVIDPDGQVVAQVPLMATGMVVVDLDQGRSLCGRLPLPEVIMEPGVEVVEVEASDAAVIRARLPMREIPRGVMPLVDKVWKFIRGGGVPDHGHNIWIYHHRPDGVVDVEIGVQVSAPFTERDGVVCTKTPAGRAAHAVYYGEYDKLPTVHRAILEWCREQGLTPSGHNWELYGDMDEDPNKRRTDVYHLVK